MLHATDLVDMLAPVQGVPPLAGFLRILYVCVSRPPPQLFEHAEEIVWALQLTFGSAVVRLCEMLVTSMRQQAACPKDDTMTQQSSQNAPKWSINTSNQKVKTAKKKIEEKHLKAIWTFLKIHKKNH